MKEYKKSKAYSRWQIKQFFGCAVFFTWMFVCYPISALLSQEYEAVVYLGGLGIGTIVFSKLTLKAGWKCLHCKAALPTRIGHIKFLTMLIPANVVCCPNCGTAIL